MSGLFGIFHRDGSPVALATLETMRDAMAHWGRDGSDIWLDGYAGLGQARTLTIPEAPYEKLPRAHARGVVFTAAGRVDNREELIRDRRLEIEDSISNLRSPTPDGDLLLHAYLRWGEDCVNRIHGDWAFAAWHPAERKLFLARDRLGNTALHYHASPRLFAFASSPQALLALNLAPVEFDELYLAQVLVVWPAYHGERTIHRPIRRLPPAHTLTVTSDRLDVRQYWRLEDTPELRLPRREDYVEAFREVFDEAVRARLRSPHPKGVGAELKSAIAVSLSGGLDSGSVTATAARLLRNQGKRLTAFTSVPLSDTSLYVKKNFGDELPFAQATARFAGNVDLCPITAAGISPIQGIRRALEIYNEPGHAAGNYYWILEVREAAQARDCRVLLNGQMGNCGMSWTGNLFSQSLAFWLRHLGGRRAAKETFKRLKQQIRWVMPPGLLAGWQRRRIPRDWHRFSAITPDFARRLNLLDQLLVAPDSLLVPAPRDPRAQRYRMILPGRSFDGALQAELGAVYGLEMRDPTGDARVLEFALSVPDRIFMDTETGIDRWLIREAMKGRLPDEVRLNRNRGRQAGDLVPRLRACANEVETALEELAGGPAAEYVDVPYMREVWSMIRTQDSPEAFRKAITVLTRGIMAGLWVNGL